MKLLLRILNKFKLLKLVNLNTTIKLNEKSVKIPILGSTGYNNLNISESWMIEVLKLLKLPKNQIIIDVGVNIGQTLIKIKSLYPDIEYIGYEPNPYCIFYLEKLIKVNNWEKTNIIPSGVANYSGIEFLDYYSDDITDSSASIITDYRQSCKVYKREIITVLHIKHTEKLFNNKISAIKIDVEGAELGVIQSFKEKISEDRPFLLVEILPTYTTENKSRITSQTEIEKILKTLNYGIYRIQKDSENQFLKLVKIETIGIHDNMDLCDYIFSPTELDLK